MKKYACQSRSLIATSCGAFAIAAVAIVGLTPTLAQAQEGTEELDVGTNSLSLPCTPQPCLSDVVDKMKYEPLNCGVLKIPQTHAASTNRNGTQTKAPVNAQNPASNIASSGENNRQLHSLETSGGLKAAFSGIADYYSDYFHGKRTASGQLHDRMKFTAAHRSLPFGTKLKVVNRHNGKSCVVTVNDRGPFTPNRIIDLSKAAALELGMMNTGSRMVDCYIVDSQKF